MLRMPEHCAETNGGGNIPNGHCATPPPTIPTTTCPRHKPGKPMTSCPSASPPGPHGVPIFGQAFNLDTSHMHLQFMDWQKRHGDFFMFKVIGKHYLVVSHPEILRKLFITCPHAQQFNDRPESFMGAYVIKETQDIIFRNCDDKQKCLKIAATEYIERTLLHENWFYEQWCSDMRDLKTDLGSKPDRPVKILDVLDKLATKTIALLLSGRSIHESDAEFQSLNAFMETGNELGTVKNQTILTAMPCMRKFPGNLKDLYDTVRVERKQLKQRFITENTCGRGVVAMLQKLSASLLEEKAEDWLTDDFILGVIMDFTAAAIVPLQNTLSVLFLVLVHHPGVQAKIRQELATLAAPPSVDDVMKMPYLQAVVLEVKRFHTPLPISARHCTRSGDVKFDKYTIPKNTEIFSNLFGIHHDERFWQDPWSFNPDRFLADDGSLVPDDHPNRKNLIAGGVGVRACVGMKFAEYILALTAASIVQNFTLLPESEESLPACDPRTFETGVVTRSPDFSCKLVPHSVAS